MKDVFSKISMRVAALAVMFAVLIGAHDLDAATTQTFAAGEALATGVRVKLSAATVVTAGAADEDIGTTISLAASSANVAVAITAVGETANCIASGAITVGTDVYPAASGKVSATVTGKRIGKALNTTTTDGDAIKVLRLATAVDRVVITKTFAAASVDDWIFVCDRAYTVISIKEVHSVVGGSGAVVDIRKVTAAGTDAPGAAASTTVKELLATAFDLVSTVNVTVTGTLSVTAANLQLAAGDKIGSNLAGTLTGLAGCIVTIELAPR